MSSKTITIVSAIIACSIFILYYLAFYPGYMSFDSAYHYRQLQSGEWTTFQPVIILLFWKVSDTIISGPGGLFLLFLLIYVVGLYLICISMQGSHISRILLVLCALLPVNIMIFPHIWKDIGLLVFTLLSIGFLTLQLRQQHFFWLCCSIFFLWLAVLFRFEAILYLFPLIFFLGKQVVRHYDNRSPIARNRKIFIFFILFSVLSVSSNRALVNISNSQKVTLWPTIALWDIARVSVSEKKQLLPSFTVGATMDVSDLSQATKTWTNTTLFSDTKAGVNAGLLPPFKDEQYRHLMKLWVSLPFRYPKSYFLHRWTLFKDLIRFDETPNKPQSLFWINQIVTYGEQFPINHSALNQKINQGLSKYKDNTIFKPWFYLLIAVFILLWGYRRSLTEQQALARHLLYASFLSVIVLFFLAPAAEQRYLIILFNLVPIAACLTWAKQKHAEE